MWAHYFVCTRCKQQVKMVTNEVSNPMRDRVGLHASLYGGDEASAYYHGAEISLLRKNDSKCTGTLQYQPGEVRREVVKPRYDPNAKVTEGSLATVTEEVWEALPTELQKKLVNVLSSAAPAQGGQGVKSLAGAPKYKGQSYTFELKFLGAFGDHRCYGNKVGDKVQFSAYDPNGSLH